MEYREEDFLMLSGIQHFTFCRRQWALIYIEQQWEENLRTVEGHIMHENAHGGKLCEKRGDTVISRSMSVFSRRLGISGICDVVEFHKTDGGVKLHGLAGKYDVVPVEYKRGSPKENDADVLQLAAQAMCLEEMLACDIHKGYLYYGEQKKRTVVDISDTVREKVKLCCMQMHQLYERCHTPKVKISKACNACSIKNLCLPKLCKDKSAKQYINDTIKGDAE